MILELSDWSGRVSYVLEVHSALALENSQHLLEVIIAALKHVLETIPEEAFLYQERQVLIERHNAEISDDEVPF